MIVVGTCPPLQVGMCDCQSALDLLIHIKAVSVDPDDKIRPHVIDILWQGFVIEVFQA
jgi:hypothetical protein